MALRFLWWCKADESVAVLALVALKRHHVVDRRIDAKNGAHSKATSSLLSHMLAWLAQSHIDVQLPRAPIASYLIIRDITLE